MNISSDFLRNNLRHLLVVLAAVSTLGFSACSDDDDDEEPVVTEERAQQDIQAAFAQGGVSTQVSQAVELANDFGVGKTAACNQSDKDTLSFSFSDTTNGSFSMAFEYIWDYSLQCINNSPETFTFDLSSSGDVQFNDSQAGQGQIIYDITHVGSLTNLTTGSEYTYNASQYNSNVDATVDNESYTAAMDIDFNNIKVDKITGQINSGTAVVDYSGTDQNGLSFQYNVNITFQGNGQATGTINGSQFTITV